MKAFIVSLVLALLLIVGSNVQAQSQTPWIGTGGVYGWVDVPAADQFVNRAGFAIAGWAFNCQAGGQQPQSIRVWLMEAGNSTPIPVPVEKIAAIPRPDVKAAFAGDCPELGSYTGFWLLATDTNALPFGTFTLIVEFADSYGVRYNLRTITLQ